MGGLVGKRDLTVVVLLAPLLCVLLAAPALAFTDVSESHPYHDAITRLADQGIIDGYGDGRFGPNAPVLRAQFAKMITGTFGLSVWDGEKFAGSDSGYPFSDVPQQVGRLYPDDYVRIAVYYGITKGITPKLFAPYRDITRLQVVSMVVRAFNTLRPDYLDPDASGIGSAWLAGTEPHTANVRVAKGNGLLAGLPLSSLNSWALATRAEVAQILSNALSALEDPPGLVFKKDPTSEAELVLFLDENIEEGWAGYPDIYLPEELPDGYAVAQSGQSVVLGGPFEPYGGVTNPAVGLTRPDDYAVIYTDGGSQIVFMKGVSADRGDAPLSDAGLAGKYGSLQYFAAGDGAYVINVPGDTPWSSGGQVMAYQEDLDEALELAQSVRLVKRNQPSLAWSETGSVPDEVDVRDLDFVDRDRGWLAGEAADGTDVLHSTKDGGESWETVAEGSTAPDIVGEWPATDFYDEENGWVLTTMGPAESGGGETYYDRWTFSVSVKDDSRAPWQTTWQTREITEDYFMPQGMEMIGPDSGLVYGSGIHGRGAVIYRTADDGESWDMPAIPDSWSSNGLAASDFIDASTGWLAGAWTSVDQGGHVVARTDDGGETWVAVYEANEGPHDLWYRDMDFLDSSIGLIVGEEGADDSGLLLRTTDGGNTWERVSLPVTYDLDHVAFLTSDVAVAGGEQGLIWSEDGGLTWMPVFGPSILHMGHASERVWIVTADGHIVWGRPR